MPPKKVVDASKPTTGDEGNPNKELAIREGINIEVGDSSYERAADLNLPKSIVTRLAKGVLPPNTQIQGNAMLAMTKSATVFVNYLASHANENAQRQNRKGVQTVDVFAALKELEFPDWEERLESELAKHLEIQTDKRNVYRKKIADNKGGTTDGEGPQPEDGEDLDANVSRTEPQSERDGQPASKKARVESNGGAQEGSNRDEHIADEEGDEDAGQQDEDEEEDDEDNREERLEAEEQSDDQEQAEVDDEALDNGGDSD